MSDSHITKSEVGYRLQYMEVLNWGTFNSQVWKIVPEGNNSLLTGSIGSGKSTLVDALTCLIVPHHKIVFNKAASAENKERSLPSYIKGFYKHEKDELTLKEKAISLRYTSENDATFSIILANFNNRGYNQNLTLAQVFWIQNDKVQKLLLISKEALNLKTHFNAITDAQELRKRLKSNPQIEVFDDNFSQYSQQFRRHFNMGEQAIDLFNQTVSMKSVSSLTTFVRDHMLEKTDVKQQIEELKKRFADLSKTHEKVQSLRQQKEVLFPLVNLKEQHTDTQEKINDLNGILQALPAFFATRKYDLLEKEIQNCTHKLNRLTNQLTEIETQLDSKSQAESRIRQDIRNNGGQRIEELEKTIKESEGRKSTKKERHSSYQSLTEACNLPTANTDKTFYANLQKLGEQLPTLTTKQELLEKQQVDKAVQLRTLVDNITKDEVDLESLKKRKTQLPGEILNIRQQIIDDLDIPEEEIPFVGELLKVREDYKTWEGAIEKFFHNFGMSMIVPEKYYKQVSQYVNDRTLRIKSADTNLKKGGQRLVYIKVPAVAKYKIQSDIDDDSILNKLEIKDDCLYQEWLEQELYRSYNLRCVDLSEFQKQRDVITIEGQYKTGEFRNIKDDRRELWDRRNFVLGWTNTEKINAIQQGLIELYRQKKTQQEDADGLKNQLTEIKTLQTKLNQLAFYKNWNEINWQDEVKDIEKLKKEKTELESSNNVLATLQVQLDALLMEISDLKGDEKEKREQVGGFKNNIEDYNNDKQTCQTIKDTILPAEAELYYPKIEERLNDTALTFKNTDHVQNAIHKKISEKDGEKDKLQSVLKKTELDIIRKMKEFKNKFPSESTELSEEMEAINEYLVKLNDIIEQDLPKHEKTLKDMLNENTIHDITAFDNKLDIHFKDIKSKIAKINEHLKDIEYNKGTYIRIEDDRSPDQDITNFKNELKACYSGIMDNNDAYINDRFNKVKALLDKFSSQKDTDIKWTEKVTDVRNWLMFNASELYNADHSRKDFYSGTGGKSGGQKEKLAYTILASALAYQFGLTYGEERSKSFRFVVIDEAFGRGDDESTRFGLDLFNKLNLQLLIVTPLQKIHIIENHVNAVHYVSNPEGNNSEVQNLTVEEYRAEKLRQELMSQNDNA